MNNNKTTVTRELFTAQMCMGKKNCTPVFQFNDQSASLVFKSHVFFAEARGNCFSIQRCKPDGQMMADGGFQSGRWAGTI